MNQGTIAIAGTLAMYSSCLGRRLARVSATPYIPTANNTVAEMNHPAPASPAWKSIPRRTAKAIRAAT